MSPRLAPTVWLVLLLFCAQASGQAIKDPMRPPPGVGPAAAANGHVPAAMAGPQLQSVMLSPTRRSAIISGQLVHRGEHYGDAVLAEVAEDHVVLRRGESTQVLKMYPGVAKRQPKSKKGSDPDF